MKSSVLFKIPGILVGLAAILVLSPASKAQSEIAPDHFDGTDSWEAAAHHKVAASKSQQERVATQVNHHRLVSRASREIATKRKTSQATAPRLFRKGAILSRTSRKNNGAAVAKGKEPT